MQKENVGGFWHDKKEICLWAEIHKTFTRVYNLRRCIMFLIFVDSVDLEKSAAIAKERMRALRKKDEKAKKELAAKIQREMEEAETEADGF